MRNRSSDPAGSRWPGLVLSLIALAGIATVLSTGCGSSDPATTAETNSAPDPVVAAAEPEPVDSGAPTKPPGKGVAHKRSRQKTQGADAVTRNQGQKKKKKKATEPEPDSAASRVGKTGGKAPKPSPSAAEQAAQGTAQGGAAGPSAADLAN